ncbi:hypothetical protein DW651_21045 [Subdoligranulum sp. AM23-21AC]|nr:hypothetical protein DW651_21045 [Subdoligranulum sp. AM23-21AC]
MACARIKKYQRTTISPSTARIAKKPICRIALERQALFIYCFTPMMYRSPRRRRSEERRRGNILF